jgi:hypothetical protein
MFLSAWSSSGVRLMTAPRCTYFVSDDTSTRGDWRRRLGDPSGGAAG